MEDEQVDCTILIGQDHATHLCGYARYFAGPSAVVVGHDRSRTLIVMQDEVDAATEDSEADVVVGFGEHGFGFDLNPVAALLTSIAELPAVAAASRFGLASAVPGADAGLVATLSGAPVDVSAAIARIRLFKDADELERIRAAYDLCWLAQAAVGEAAAAGVSEIELYSLAQSTAQVAAGQPIEFICDLLSGTATANVCCPVHVAGPRQAADGDAVIADVVVRSNGYWGDTAETHAVGANSELAEIRAELLRILAAAAQRLVPGATGNAIFAEIAQAVASTFPGGTLPHHGGHGLGLGCFDDPHLIPSDTSPLEAGMVVAVEPGVYFPGRLGVRVENAFIVTESGGVELRSAELA
jgi:Xaa-Pro aminopeptidase